MKGLLDKKVISWQHGRARHIQLPDPPGQLKMSVRQVDLDNFSSKSHLIWYWAKQILEVREVKILRNHEPCMERYEDSATLTEQYPGLQLWWFYFLWGIYSEFWDLCEECDAHAYTETMKQRHHYKLKIHIYLYQINQKFATWSIFYWHELTLFQSWVS